MSSTVFTVVAEALQLSYRKRRSKPSPMATSETDEGARRLASTSFALASLSFLGFLSLRVLSQLVEFKRNPVDYTLPFLFLLGCLSALAAGGFVASWIADKRTRRTGANRPTLFWIAATLSSLEIVFYAILWFGIIFVQAY
jgi:lipid-A-disaccharide synthase-like uncharacterized protein